MAKKAVIRGGQKLLGTLGDGTGEDILTISSDKSFSKVGSGTPATYITNALNSAHLLVGNSLDVATPRAITGDVLISNTGVTSIATGVIVNADISASAGISYSKLLLTNSIVNADIATGANITRTKLASGTAYRLVANDATGVIGENPAITANRALISNANGQVIASSVTNSELNFVSGASSNLQTQINTTIVGLPTNTLVQNPTAAQDFFAIMWDDSNQEWILSDPILQGLPIGGTSNQYLKKVSNTNYDVTWDTLTLADVSDVVSTANDLNLLSGLAALGITNTELFYLDGLSGNIQSQFGNKLGTTLVQNAIWVGNASNVATQLPGGTNGQVLTIVGTTPTWQAVTGTGTVTSVDISGGTTGLSASGGPVTTSGTLTLSGTLVAGSGGTGQAGGYTKGDILVATNATTLVKLAVGADGEVLTADSAEASGLKWDTGSGGAGLVDGDYGDITVSGVGTVITIDEDINKDWTGNHTFLDGNFRLLDNADPTKILALQLSGITTGTTRTLTVPDLNGTIALLGASGNGAALTNIDDTNVTLTIDSGGSKALLTATQVTLGWTGTLAVARGGTAANNAADARTNLGAVGLTGNETIAGVKTFSSDPIVPDEAYGVSWDGSNEVPTKNAIYDKIQSFITTINGGFGITFDGQGSVVLANTKCYFRMPTTGTISGWSIVADGTNPTCTIDVWKIASGTALPTVADTIMGTKPALALGNAIKSTTLTGWTTSFDADDIFCINIDACTAATKINFIIYR